MRHNVVLEGERIRLRPVTESDLPHWVEWLNDPEVWEHLADAMDFSKPLTLAAEQEWFKNQLNKSDEMFFSIELKTGSRHIGGTGLHGINKAHGRATFGVTIGDKGEWNKRFGTETTDLMLAYCFDELGLHRVALTVDEDHPRAIRCYENCGFKEEGVQREDTKRPDGSYRNSFIMAILHDEWRKR